MRVFQEKGGQLWGKEGGLRGDTNTKREWWYILYMYMYIQCTCTM